jgi:hypothetical protein
LTTEGLTGKADEEEEEDDDDGTFELVGTSGYSSIPRPTPAVIETVRCPRVRGVEEEEDGG